MASRSLWTGRTTWAAVFATTLLLLLSPDAQAQSAAALFTEGKLLFRQARYAPSIEQLNQAAKRTRDGKLLGRVHQYLGFNLAVMGREQAARSAFRAALTHDPTLKLEPIKRSIAAIFKEVRAGLQGQLAVVADRAGALVFVDGKQAGPAPHKAALPIGAHRLEVRTPDGRFAFSKQVVLFPQRTIRVEATLRPARGKLSVRSLPSGAEVRLGDQVLGKTPLVGVAVGAGEQTLAISFPDYQEHRQKVQVVKDQTRTIEVKLRASAHDDAEAPVGASLTEEGQPGAGQGSKVWAWTTLGAGAALAVTAGILFGLGASQGGSAHDSYMEAADAAPPDNVEAVGQHRSDIESARTKIVVGGVLMGLAAAGLGCSLYLFVKGGSEREAEESSEEELAAAVGFVPSARGGALSIQGRF